MIDLLLAPFIAAMVILLSHSYFGLHIIQRGVIFVDLALAQIAALGGTVALLMGVQHGSALHYGASFVATLLGALLFSLSRFEESAVPQEAFIGITFVVASAAVILVAGLSPEGAEHFQETMTGTLIWVNWRTVGIITLSYAAVGLIHYLLRRPLLAISFAPGRVRRIRAWDFLFYATFGFVITQSVNVAGVLMVFSVLVMPTAISFLYTRSFSRALAIAWISGTAAVILGLTVSFSLDLATGPVLVLAFGAVLILMVLLWPWFGLKVSRDGKHGLVLGEFEAEADPQKATPYAGAAAGQ